MSKFFGKKGQETSSSEEESSEEEVKDTKKKVAAKKKHFADSSDEEDEKRVVVSTTDKRTEVLKEKFDKMKNHIKISDFVALENDFNEIQTEMEKCIGQVFASDKFTTLPPWVLNNLMQLEDCVLEVTNEQKKKMQKLNSQSFNKLRQKLKKYLTECGDDENRFADQVAKFRENPVVPDEKEGKKTKKKEASDSDAEDSDDSDSSDDDSSSSGSSSSGSDAKTKKKTTKKAAKKDSGSDSGSSSSGSSSSGSDSGSDSGSSSDDDSDGSGSSSGGSDSEPEKEVVKKGELPKKYAFLAFSHEEKTPEQRRWKWVKFENLPEDMKPYIRPPTKAAADKGDRQNKKKRVKEDKEEEQEHALDIVDDRDLDYSKMENVDTVLNKYKNQQISRRNFDPELQITVLQLMLKAQSANKSVRIEILMLLIDTYFASAKSTSTGFFERDTWLTTCGKINDLLTDLKSQNTETKKQKAEAKAEDGADLDTFLSIGEAQIFPAIVNFIDKLHQQLYKAFQTLSPTTMQYLQRLRDECSLLKLCDLVIEYLKKHDQQAKIAQVGLIKLDHIYFKHDQIYQKTKEALKGKSDKLKELYFLDKPSEVVVSELVENIIKHSDRKMKIKATLLQVYHLAIHNKFSEAKDLLMKARLSQIIAKQQVSNQIHYNRAIVQIGLCAFRQGLFEECNSVLVDVCQSPKLKESLAQGTSNFSRQQEKTIEEEVEEKKRFVPAHLHINLEMLDCVYMTTSMFLEIPNITQNKTSIDKKMINRNFRKLIEQYDMKGIQFVPQNSRDYIVFASRNLHQSKWQESFNNLCQIKIFHKLPEFQSGSLKDALLAKVKECALKIFMIESQNQYESHSLDVMQNQFKMDKAPIIKQASKLIAKGDILAKVDPVKGHIVFEGKSGQVGTLPGNDRKEMEHLQMSHLDKISYMVDNNDRCIDLLINQNHYIQSSTKK